MSEPPRVAVVTGAGSGIGRACARRLGADGFAVVVNDISAESAEQTAGLLAAAGAQARAARRRKSPAAGFTTGQQLLVDGGCYLA